jgi:hypothetical protein
VVGYRKAKCFVERHRKEFDNPEVIVNICRLRKF